MFFKIKWTTIIAQAGVLIIVGALISKPVSADMSGNIEVVTKYVYRGMTNDAENDNTAVQGGFDYTHASGIYLGYWGSNLDYGNTTTNTGFENDLIAGYAGSAGLLTYSAGLAHYHYMEVEDANGTEFSGSVGHGDVTLSVKYLLTDVAWGNTGDMYWTLDYKTALPKDFSFNASLGYSFYNGDDNEKMCAAAGEAPNCSVTTEDNTFSNLDLTLTHPIGTTGAEMSLTYIKGGEDRKGDDQKDIMVLGIKYEFDI